VSPSESGGTTFAAMGVDVVVAGAGEAALADIADLFRA
jgi:hypothetical protein